MFCGAIDWDATGSMLQGIGAVLGVLAVLIAAFIGSNTFKSWRLQKLTERRMEQAERILTATYNARRALSIVRNVAMFNHEFYRAELKLKEAGEWNEEATPEDKRSLTEMRAYYLRLEAADGEQKAVTDSLAIARALFGEGVEAALEKLNHQFWTVKVHVDAKYRHRNDERVSEQLREKIDRVLYPEYPPDGENEVDDAVASSVAEVEKLCLPVLRDDVPKASWWQWSKA